MDSLVSVLIPPYVYHADLMLLACFMGNPKMSHKKAAKHVARRLKGSLDEGIFMKPDGSEGLICALRPPSWKFNTSKVWLSLVLANHLIIYKDSLL